MQVLLFFILVIGTFTVIIQHRLFLPVSLSYLAVPATALSCSLFTILGLQVEGPHADPQLHRKHLRIENQDLREQVPQHSFIAQYEMLLHATCLHVIACVACMHNLSSSVHVQLYNSKDITS